MCAPSKHSAGVGSKKGAVVDSISDFGEHDLAGCYEQLRSEVLGEKRCVRQSLGWSHFIRHGMATWLQAQTIELPEPAIVKREQIAQNVLPWPHNEVVSVMAGMALGCILEVAR